MAHCGCCDGFETKLLHSFQGVVSGNMPSVVVSTIFDGVVPATDQTNSL